MTATSETNVQASFAATLVDEWARGGVAHAVVAPGSRSTPLAVALAADGRIAVHVVLDERAAAYQALGIGLATGVPAVVLTTSGTAAAELHPAVVEAHQAGVPMIAVTADRPPELHHVGAPQTIEQAQLFMGVVRWAFDPGPPAAAARGAWRSLASRAVLDAIGHPAGPGPVHLNLPFREPLLGDADDVPAGRDGGRPWHERAPRVLPPPAALVERLRGLAGRRGIIVAGGGAGDPAAVHEAAAALGWPVLADARSGARLRAATTVAAADAVLRAPEFAAAHRPEVVLRLGGSWASKVLAGWLAGLEVEQVVVDPFGLWPDPDRTASTVVDCDPTLLCRALGEPGISSARQWLGSWVAAEAAAQAAITAVVGSATGLTEPAIARRLVADLPDGTALLTSSSMPVRDVEWYGAPRDRVQVLANRGANGIDGVTSTALGVARARTAAGAGPTAVLLGDLAFLHDQGGLLGAAASGADCTLVVVDNDGGGIFSFLPQASALDGRRFEQLFGTPHGLDLGAIAAAHGIPVSTPTDMAGFSDSLHEAVTAGGVRMLHVRTDRAANVAAHDAIHLAVAAAL